MALSSSLDSPSANATVNVCSTGIYNHFSSVPIEHTPLIESNVDKIPADMTVIESSVSNLATETVTTPTSMDRDSPVNGAAIELSLTLLPPTCAGNLSRPTVVSDVVPASFRNDYVVGSSSASHDVTVPPDDLCDFMHFISNNLSSSSLPTMTAQFCESFSQEWVAQYLVRRATIESNLHTLYCIDSLVDCPLKYLVLQETSTRINAILLATSPLNYSTAGSGLKKLDHWLVLQTLAKYRCVSDTELPVREILINAVHKGPSFLLPSVIFAAKCSGALIKLEFLAHLTLGLWTPYYCWASCMGFQALVVVFA